MTITDFLLIVNSQQRYPHCVLVNGTNEKKMKKMAHELWNGSTLMEFPLHSDSMHLQREQSDLNTAADKKESRENQ